MHIIRVGRENSADIAIYDDQVNAALLDCLAHRRAAAANGHGAVASIRERQT